MDLHSPREWLTLIFRSAKTITVFVVGVALVVGGLAMLVLPGPGILVVFAGFAVLATEFAWAETVLDRGKQGVARVKDRAQRTWRDRRGR